MGWFRKKNLQPHKLSAGLNWEGMAGTLRSAGSSSTAAHGTTWWGWWGWGGSTLALLSLGPESPSLPQIPQPASSPPPCSGPSAMRLCSLRVSGSPQPRGLPGTPAPEAPGEAPALGPHESLSRSTKSPMGFRPKDLAAAYGKPKNNLTALPSRTLANFISYKSTFMHK